VATSTTSGSPSTEAQRTRTASMEDLPHTPHEDEVTCSRSSDGSGTGTPGRSSTERVLYSPDWPLDSQARTVSIWSWPVSSPSVMQ
jgi:hypothetical protein